MECTDLWLRCIDYVVALPSDLDDDDAWQSTRKFDFFRTCRRFYALRSEYPRDRCYVAIHGLKYCVDGTHRLLTSVDMYYHPCRPKLSECSTFAPWFKELTRHYDLAPEEEDAVRDFVTRNEGLARKILFIRYVWSELEKDPFFDPDVALDVYARVLTDNADPNSLYCLENW